MVERIVLGCGNFGGIGSAPELFGQGESDDEAAALMDAAWELGLRWFDTADAYGGGRSESAIGKWIRASGRRPSLTTKTYNPMDADGDRGLSRDRIRRQIETSLGRLGVDRVDVYLAHDYDDATPLEETVGAFEELREEGTIGDWGVSNFPPRALRELLELGRPALVQDSYSLLDRRAEDELLPICADAGIAFQAYSPLAGGWLTGKYRRGEDPPAGSRMTLRPEPYRHLETESVFDALEEFEQEATARGVAPGSLAVAWVVGHPAVTAAVIGPRRPEHLEIAREAAALELPAAERDRLSSLFPWRS